MSELTKKPPAKEAGTLEVQGVEIRLVERGAENYISLTDMATIFDSEGTSSHIENWLRAKSTVDFLGVWEKLNNPGFNSVEFDGIRLESGSNRFKLSAKIWIQKTNGIGLIAKRWARSNCRARQLTRISCWFGKKAPIRRKNKRIPLKTTLSQP